MTNPPSRIVLEFDARLVEDAVALALRARERSPYWLERSRIYEIEDEEERSREFIELDRRQFGDLNLAAPFQQALSEQPLVERGIPVGRVLPAASRRDEGAELYVVRQGSGEEERAGRSLGVRLRSQSLLDPGALLGFLRHELYHIADMIDPAFGYDPAPPGADGGPMHLQLILARYRVLWDIAIDGRLQRAGRAPDAVRAARLRDFTGTFPMLGDRGPEAFSRLFEIPSPKHRDLMRWAMEPRAIIDPEAPAAAHPAGICSLCRCPGALPGSSREPLAPEVLREIRGDFPDWDPAAGICPQCMELYRRRPLSRSAAELLPRG